MGAGLVVAVSAHVDLAEVDDPGAQRRAGNSHGDRADPRQPGDRGAGLPVLPEHPGRARRHVIPVVPPTLLTLATLEFCYVMNIGFCGLHLWCG